MASAMFAAAAADVEECVGTLTTRGAKKKAMNDNRQWINGNYRKHWRRRCQRRVSKVSTLGVTAHNDLHPSAGILRDIPICAIYTTDFKYSGSLQHLRFEISKQLQSSSSHCKHPHDIYPHSIIAKLLTKALEKTVENKLQQKKLTDLSF
ncbi:hypothetical protein BDD12DRAFT_173426 [Trichophaea hybrida]|nr:hypothetical protein BDD12DRAFT_173426 [Trichophaea hybrida]